jgi:hypothetical protein
VSEPIDRLKLATGAAVNTARAPSATPVAVIVSVIFSPASYESLSKAHAIVGEVIGRTVTGTANVIVPLVSVIVVVPALTPVTDSFWQRVSGAVFLSKLSGGVPERYIPVGEVRIIEDWPSVNLMIRRSAFLDIGGFNSPYWPGEDTKLCLDLVKKTKKKILYIPNLIVWHHRRAGLIGHLKQIGGYAIHRGYFAKVYPETSRKFLYFIPTIFVLFIFFSICTLIWFQKFSWVVIAGFICYALALCKAYLDMRKYESHLVSIVAIGYTILTHFWYGVKFSQGLFTKNLVSRLR